MRPTLHNNDTEIINRNLINNITLRIVAPWDKLYIIENYSDVLEAGPPRREVTMAHTDPRSGKGKMDS